MPDRDTDKCLVCKGEALPYFMKDFGPDFNLGQVHYWRCGSCKFCYSRSHYRMDRDQWSLLNSKYHAAYQGSATNSDDPNWRARLAAQKDVITKMRAVGAISITQPWLDWGAGDGSLSRLLHESQITLQNYDMYLGGDGFLTGEELTPKSFGFVITTSVFEHVMDLDIIQGISDLVSPTGVLALHTLVSEEVPNDPDWFYLVPVHVSFFTNRSMEILFEKWGYASSVYHLPSRLWFLFRDPKVDVIEVARSFNASCTEPVLFASERSFMKYWT